MKKFKELALNKKSKSPKRHRRPSRGANTPADQMERGLEARQREYEKRTAGLPKAGSLFPVESGYDPNDMRGAATATVRTGMSEQSRGGHDLRPPGLNTTLPAIYHPGGNYPPPPGNYPPAPGNYPPAPGNYPPPPAYESRPPLTHRPGDIDRGRSRRYSVTGDRPRDILDQRPGNEFERGRSRYPPSSYAPPRPRDDIGRGRPSYGEPIYGVSRPRGRSIGLDEPRVVTVTREPRASEAPTQPRIVTVGRDPPSYDYSEYRRPRVDVSPYRSRTATVEREPTFSSRRPNIYNVTREPPATPARPEIITVETERKGRPRSRERGRTRRRRSSPKIFSFDGAADSPPRKSKDLPSIQFRGDKRKWTQPSDEEGRYYNWGITDPNLVLLCRTSSEPWDPKDVLGRWQEKYLTNHPRDSLKLSSNEEKYLTGKIKDVLNKDGFGYKSVDIKYVRQGTKDQRRMWIVVPFATYLDWERTIRKAFRWKETLDREGYKDMHIEIFEPFIDRPPMGRSESITARKRSESIRIPPPAPRAASLNRMPHGSYSGNFSGNLSDNYAYGKGDYRF